LMTREALEEIDANCTLNVVEDGAEALDFLYHEGKHKESVTPDLILLDLNLPKKNGREVLAKIKSDDDLKHIPVIVLTTSKAEEDIESVYRLQANCYVIKPVDFNQFLETIRAIEEFWLSVATLKPGSSHA
jgi:CheY-like chemotaxis protein